MATLRNMMNTRFLKISMYFLFLSVSFSGTGQDVTFSPEGNNKGNIHTIRTFEISPEQPDKKELCAEIYLNRNGKKVMGKSWKSGKLYETDSVVYDNAGNQIGKYIIYNNNGKVDSIVHTYDDFGNILTEIISAYNLNYKSEYWYDKKGELLMRKDHDRTYDGYVLKEQEEITGNGKTRIKKSYIEGRVYSVSVEKFNSDNNLISGVYTIPEKKWEQKTIVKYDKKGRIIRSTYIKDKKVASRERHSYKSDRWGNPVEHVVYRSSTLFERKTYTYDSLQNLIEYRVYDQEGLSWEILKEFDENNRMVKKQRFNRDSEIPLRIETFKYDQHNNLTENTVENHHKDSNKITTQSYHYQYDETGNWVYLKMYLDSEIFGELKREIVYF